MHLAPQYLTLSQCVNASTAHICGVGLQGGAPCQHPVSCWHQRGPPAVGTPHGFVLLLLRQSGPHLAPRASIPASPNSRLPVGCAPTQSCPSRQPQQPRRAHRLYLDPSPSSSWWPQQNSSPQGMCWTQQTPCSISRSSRRQKVDVLFQSWQGRHGVGGGGSGCGGGVRQRAAQRSIQRTRPSALGRQHLQQTQPEQDVHIISSPCCEWPLFCNLPAVLCVFSVTLWRPPCPQQEVMESLSLGRGATLHIKGHTHPAIAFSTCKPCCPPPPPPTPQPPHTHPP